MNIILKLTVLLVFISFLASFDNDNRFNHLTITTQNDTLDRITVDGAEFFPYYILTFRDLKKLSLINCTFETLPNEFKKLTELEELNIINCTNLIFDSLSYMLEKNPNIKILSLESNELKHVPQGMSKLKNLEKLDMSNNHITMIPYEIFKLNNLQSIDFSNNRIRELQIDKNNYSIEFISLYKNRMDDLPIGLDKLKGLKQLYIGWNTDLDFYKICAIVEHLDNLNMIIADGCKANGIPVNVSNLKKVTNAVWASAMFTKEEIEKMRKIGIKIGGNPIIKND